MATRLHYITLQRELSVDAHLAARPSSAQAWEELLTVTGAAHTDQSTILHAWRGIRWPSSQRRLVLKQRLVLTPRLQLTPAWQCDQNWAH